jgi:signal peptidase I
MSAVWGWSREALLAAGLITLLVVGLSATTGTFPPMVVVESGSMMHSAEGEVGSIDPGDLVLVMKHDDRVVVSYLEGIEPSGILEGYTSHGKAGDVIIYRKNGGTDTPVIHRIILRVIPHNTTTPDRASGICPPNASLDSEWIDADDGQLGTCVFSWDVPGTPLRDVVQVSWDFPAIFCNVPVHQGMTLSISGWDPAHAGYVTLGDNNGCGIDQKEVTLSGYGVDYGLRDENGKPVHAVRMSELEGVAGAEIPWVGTVKLMFADNSAQVSGQTFRMLGILLVVLITVPLSFEWVSRRILRGAPEIPQAEQEALRGGD